MSKLHTFSTLLAVGLMGAAFAQTPDPMPSTNPGEGTAADSTPPGQTETRDAAGQSERYPMPSTSQAEGTAADRTAPGETPTQGADQSMSTGSQPATDTAEDTTAGSTVPGQSETAESRDSGTMTQHNDMMGAAVVSQDESTIGEVVDVVFDAKGQPEFVVISAQGESAAVPYRTASSMMSGDKVVIDQSRLQSAPKVKQGEWRSQSGNWKDDASRYWNQG